MIIAIIILHSSIIEYYNFYTSDMLFVCVYLVICNYFKYWHFAFMNEFISLFTY